jgi:peptide/nickel transport system ATP-binding protein
MATACDPDLIVLDEPTTGLDVTTQEQIVALLVDLRARLGTAMLYVTHDLGLLAGLADRIGVMYAGHMVETASAADLFVAPRHPYTKGLIGSVPRIEDPAGSRVRPLSGSLKRKELPPGCSFAPRCDFDEPSCWDRRQALEEVRAGHHVACQRWREIGAAGSPADIAPLASPRGGKEPVLALDGITLAYGQGHGLLDRLFFQNPFVAVRDLSISIAKGETFALVGESGSGKSTVARGISGLLPPAAGEICFNGVSLPSSLRERTSEDRRRIQYIFQNPDASLNPRMPVRRILARPLKMFRRCNKAELALRVDHALENVQLDASFGGRYPDQLSGGERQRVAIARALVAEPDLLLCDEVLSALDVSVQANILELLRRLKAEHSISMLFISHDLAVVRSIADMIGVLYHGQLMELGANADVFAPPYHPYTHSLLMAVPSIAAAKSRQRVRRSARRARPPATGGACAFAGRCPWQPGPVCHDLDPPWRTTATGLAIRCHLPLSELTARAEWDRSGDAPSLKEPLP